MFDQQSEASERASSGSHLCGRKAIQAEGGLSVKASGHFSRPESAWLEKSKNAEMPGDSEGAESSGRWES